MEFTQPKPLRLQGIFISSVTPISPQISLEYLAPSPAISGLFYYLVGSAVHPSWMATTTAPVAGD